MCLSAVRFENRIARSPLPPVFAHPSNPVEASEWQTKKIGENAVEKMERGGYPIPGILQSVRKRLIAKELDGTLVSKCEASVRKEQKARELEEIEEVQEAAWAAFRRGGDSVYTAKDSRKVPCISITLLLPFEWTVEKSPKSPRAPIGSG